MEINETIMGSAADYDSACRLAVALPRPSTVRKMDDGTWQVVRLLPARRQPELEDSYGRAG